MAKEMIDKEEMELRELVDNKVKQVLKVNAKSIDRDEFVTMAEQAKIGMVYLRDREMMKRIQSGQIIRMATFINVSPEMREEYARVAMPQLAELIDKR